MRIIRIAGLWLEFKFEMCKYQNKPYLAVSMNRFANDDGDDEAQRHRVS